MAPLARIAKSVVRRVVEEETDLVFTEKLPFTESVVFIPLQGPIPKPEDARAFPLMQRTWRGFVTPPKPRDPALFMTA